METIKLLQDKFKNKEISVESYFLDLFEKIEKDDCNVFISLNKDEALKKARELDQKIEKGEELGQLFGIPVSLKDNIVTENLRTTCASKMLENYVPTYDASLVVRLKNEDAIIVGKTNMDEFACGSTSETSYFGPVNNPLDRKLMPGGSSSGAAAGQKLGYSLVSLGSDTGGSVRQPAAYTSTLGYMPSYGTISRNGVVSMANSLDQVGIFANSVEDIVRTVNVIGGSDKRDLTSTEVEKLNFELTGLKDLKGYKIGYVDDFSSDLIQDEVKAAYLKTVEKMKELGAELVLIKIENKKFLSPCYSVISTSEVSSNLSRFDGIRYGYQTEDYEGLDELFKKTRTEGFGEEVKRRIAMGMYFLGSSYYREVFEKTLKVRGLIKKEVEEIFEKVDIFLTPSTLDYPAELGSKKNGTVDNFRDGDYHVIANLTGRCAINIPLEEKIGPSVQLIGNRYDDQRLLNVADLLYREVR